MRGFESLTPDCDRSSAVERLNVTQVVAGSIPVGHPNFIHAPVAQQVDARDLGSRSFGSCRFESDPGYAGSSSPTAEAAPSSSVKCRFESGDEYTRVAQGIERRSTKPGAEVRFLPWVRKTRKYMPVGCVGCTTVFQTVRPCSSHGTGSAFVAQGTEQPFRNRPVRGSNPRGGSRLGNVSCRVRQDVKSRR